MSMQIRFSAMQGEFRPAPAMSADDWVDTSCSQSPRAIGSRRWPGVSNGRYEAKHPILNEGGGVDGHMEDGQSALGYTFTCVHADGCFHVAHQGFSSTMNGGGSNISLVGEAGAFMPPPHPRAITVGCGCPGARLACRQPAKPV